MLIGTYLLAQWGAFFAGNDPQNIVIGSKLAEILEVGLGDRLVFTVAQAGSGNLSQDLFRISGIYHFNVDELDGGFAFIRLSKAQKMLGLGNSVHEIALTISQIRMADRPEIVLPAPERATSAKRQLGQSLCRLCGLPVP